MRDAMRTAILIVIAALAGSVLGVLGFIQIHRRLRHPQRRDDRTHIGRERHPHPERGAILRLGHARRRT